MLNPLVADFAACLLALAAAAWIVLPALAARPARAPTGRSFPRY